MFGMSRLASIFGGINKGVQAAGKPVDAVNNKFANVMNLLNADKRPMASGGGGFPQQMPGAGGSIGGPPMVGQVGAFNQEQGPGGNQNPQQMADIFNKYGGGMLRQIFGGGR